MTEPQELRSIDELFKNTFDNLPETPAESGWDTPSERVWDHVRHNIQAPRSGWSLQSLMILTGFAVVLAVGLYFAFGGSENAATQQEAPVVQTERPTPPEAPAASPMPESADVAAPTSPKQRTAGKLGHVKATTTQSQPAAPVAAEETRPSQDRALQRSHGAAPLPGSTEEKVPNTTEALRIERAKALEKLWKTPLDFLPVPNKKRTND